LLGRNFKKEVDSILVEINQAVSTYIPDSEISIFNENGVANFTTSNNHFIKNYFSSVDIYIATENYFDPSVMPLVNYWGFGYTDKKPVLKTDSLAIDSIQNFVGLNKVYHVLSRGGNEPILTLSKKTSEFKVQLDFSAIAKGYAVDVVSNFLQEKNLKNYLVEIGGELRTNGKNAKGKLWTTAINTPKINAQLTDYEAIIKLNNKAIATSGNYRNFHEVNGEWYGHEINPKTGFPEKSNLLSVTIMSDDCMSADAYATTKGFEGTIL